MSSGIEELRSAAARIRDVVDRVERFTVHQAADLKAAIEECEALGFSKAPLALAVAAWLEDHSKTLEGFSIDAHESLAVARLINEVGR